MPQLKAIAPADLTAELRRDRDLSAEAPIACASLPHISQHGASESQDKQDEGEREGRKDREKRLGHGYAPWVRRSISCGKAVSRSEAITGPPMGPSHAESDIESPITSYGMTSTTCLQPSASQST